MKRTFARTVSGLTAGLVLAFLTTTVSAQPKPQAPTKSLYDRLGGVYAIASVVDDFIERLLVNDTLNANPAIKAARDRVAKAGLKFQVTALVSEVTGGPQKYAGRSMKESHTQLNITAKEWDAMVGDFRKTLNQFKVPAGEQKELIDIVASTRPDIVMGAAPKP